MEETIKDKRPEVETIDLISSAYITSLAFFDFCAILLNLLLLVSMKNRQCNVIEKIQIAKTLCLILAGLICIPTDILASLGICTDFTRSFGKGRNFSYFNMFYGMFMYYYYLRENHLHEPQLPDYNI